MDTENKMQNRKQRYGFKFKVLMNIFSLDFQKAAHYES